MPRGTRHFFVLAILFLGCLPSAASSEDHFFPILDEEDAAVEKALEPSGLDLKPSTWTGEQSRAVGEPSWPSEQERVNDGTNWSDLNATADSLVRNTGPRPGTGMSRDALAWFFAGKEGHDSTLLGLFAAGRYRIDWQEIAGDVQSRGSNQGRYQWESPYLDAMPALGGRQPRYKRNGTRRYIEVRWGERRYMVADDDLVFIDFCNAINAGDEPRRSRWGRHLLRHEDWNKPVAGAPGLNPSYLAYVLRSPLQVRVIGLKDGSGRTVRSLRSRGRARLAVGRRDGIKQYHRFFLPGAYAYLVVKEVRQNDTVAEVFPGTHGPWDPRTIKPLTVGATVTTRRPPPPAMQEFDDGISSPDDPW